MDYKSLAQLSYPVASNNNQSFFTTRYGYIYAISLLPDHETLDLRQEDFEVYSFNLALVIPDPETEFCNKIPNNFSVSNSHRVPPDRKVAITVAKTIYDYFNSPRRILTYYCADDDNRASIRFRLFNRWFDQYGSKEIVRDIQEYSNGEYITILMRQDSPLMYYDLFDKY